MLYNKTNKLDDPVYCIIFNIFNIHVLLSVYLNIRREFQSSILTV